jgi:acyl-CoA dehydrogenase
MSNQHDTSAQRTRIDETVFTAEHDMFRDLARRFVAKEIEPFGLDWEKSGEGYPCELWKKAGDAGLIGLGITAEYGGSDADILFNVVLNEELGRSVAGCTIGPTVFSADLLTQLLVAFGTDAQKKAYCRGILSGAIIQCAGISEPNAGSDVKALVSRARSDGDDYLLSGQKTFISNGMHANLCYFLARTDRDVAAGRHAMSLFIVDLSAPGCERRKLDTIGSKAGSVAELFLSEVRVSRAAMLGNEGEALSVVLAHLFLADRMMLGLRALAVAELALDLTVEYTKNRVVFGKRVFDFQNTQFKLAELKTDIIAGYALRDMALRKFVNNDLDALTSSAMKLWMTQLEFRVANECLQLYGGYGYMTETPISRIFTYARAESLYAGTSEIQKGIIARYL